MIVKIFEIFKVNLGIFVNLRYIVGVNIWGWFIFVYFIIIVMNIFSCCIILGYWDVVYLIDFVNIIS